MVGWNKVGAAQHGGVGGWRWVVVVLYCVRVLPPLLPVLLLVLLAQGCNASPQIQSQK